MKISNHCYTYKLKKGVILVYSFISGDTYIFNKDEYSKFKNFELDKKTQKQLIESQIYINKKADEKITRKRHGYDNKGFGKIKRLYIDFMPTLNCNCACIYCYEDKKLRKIESNFKICDQLISFIEKKVKQTKNKLFYLDIQFHGGEPLLKMDLEISVQRFTTFGIDVLHEIFYTY